MNTTEQFTGTSPQHAAIVQPAGFWIRCGAFAIDLLLALFIPLMLSWPLSYVSDLIYSDAYNIGGVYAVFIIIHGFSLGKRMAGIEVVRIDGLLMTRFSHIRVVRCILGPAMVALLITLQIYPSVSTHVEPPISIYFGLFVASILFAPAALPRKRALHDYITGTRAVYVNKINLWRKAAIICVGLPLVAFYTTLSITNLTQWGNSLYDDKLEPNDSPETAMRLTFGQSVEGRAISKNPDVFAVEVKAGQTILFRVENRGGPADRALFTVLDPQKKILYEDILQLHTHYSSIIHPAPGTYPDVTLLMHEDFDYELRLIAKVTGVYYLVVNECAQRGSRIPFVWKYRLVANIDS